LHLAKTAQKPPQTFPLVLVLLLVVGAVGFDYEDVHEDEG
jgi:hypothetical protein